MSSSSTNQAKAPARASQKPSRISFKRIFRGIAIGVALLYISLCGFLWFDQAHFIFVPGGPEYLTPAGFKVPFQDVWVPVPSSSQQDPPQEKLHGWWLPNPDSSRVLLYLHGNGGNIASNLEHAVRLRNFGMSVLIIDYRGYGRSTNRFPSEARILQGSKKSSPGKSSSTATRSEAPLPSSWRPTTPKPAV